jgi:hypothetical protein
MINLIKDAWNWYVGMWEMLFDSLFNVIIMVVGLL